MAAPTGVNKGPPQEPAKAERTGAELAEQQTAAAKPGETVPAEAGEKAVPAGVLPAGVLPAGVVPAGVVPAQAESVEARSPEAEPGVSGLAEAEPELARAEPAGAEPAGAELTGAELTGAELTGAELTGAELTGAELTGAEAGEPTEADWDAEARRRDVSPLAVAGIILGVIALVGVAVGVLAVLTHGFRPKTVVTYRPAAVFGLRPGQCVNSGPNALNFTMLSCARPHDAEVFAVFSLPATAWPGASAVQVDASNGCASRFGSYIDPQLAGASLTQEYVYPNRSAWRAGERTVVCEVSAVNGQLTGSVRAKG